jgi:hypothetical protein
MGVDFIQHQAMVEIDSGENNAGLGSVVFKLPPALPDSTLNCILRVECFRLPQACDNHISMLLEKLHFYDK